jgi:hypothetical protein
MVRGGEDFLKNKAPGLAESICIPSREPYLFR